MYRTKFAVCCLVVAMFALAFSHVNVEAGRYDPSKGAVALRIDDCKAVSYANAWQNVLKPRGVKATWAAIIKYTSVDTDYMTWSELKDLAADGQCMWSHSVNHVSMLGMTPGQLITELAGSYQAFADNKLVPPKGFIYPLGDVDQIIRDYTSRYYKFACQVGWTGDPVYNTFPYGNYSYVGRDVYATTTLQQLKDLTTQAIAVGQVFVPMFHDVVSTAFDPNDPNNLYLWPASDFQAYVDWCIASGIQLVTLEDVMDRKSGRNLLSNPNFDFLDGAGWAAGWTRNNTASVSVTPVSVARVFSTGKQLQLVGGASEVNATTTLVKLPSAAKPYLFKFFVNSTLIAPGRLGIWVDQYDAGGNYIGGQELGGLIGPNLDLFTYKFVPNKPNTASIQITPYVEVGSIGTVSLEAFSFGLMDPPVNMAPILLLLQ